MSITVYAASDDLIEVEGDIREEFSTIDLPGGLLGGLLAFSDGNVLRITYTVSGVWRISPVAYGLGDVAIEAAPENDEDNYTDRATIDGQLKWVVLGSLVATAKGGR